MSWTESGITVLARREGPGGLRLQVASDHADRVVQCYLAGALVARQDAPHPAWTVDVGSSRVDLQACKLEYSIVSPK